jgi:hypothetical protein
MEGIKQWVNHVRTSVHMSGSTTITL